MPSFYQFCHLRSLDGYIFSYENNENPFFHYFFVKLSMQIFNIQFAIRGGGGGGPLTCLYSIKV